MRPENEEKLREIVARMPHNGVTMFISSKNELGHDQCCYKCKFTKLLSDELYAPRVSPGPAKTGCNFSGCVNDADFIILGRALCARHRDELARESAR